MHFRTRLRQISQLTRKRSHLYESTQNGFLYWSVERKPPVFGVGVGVNDRACVLISALTGTRPCFLGLSAHTLPPFAHSARAPCAPSCCSVSSCRHAWSRERTIEGCIWYEHGLHRSQPSSTFLDCSCSCIQVAPTASCKSAQLPGSACTLASIPGVWGWCWFFWPDCLSDKRCSPSSAAAAPSLHRSLALACCPLSGWVHIIARAPRVDESGETAHRAFESLNIILYV